MTKRKVWQDICNSVALHVYVATHFSPQNGLIYRRKTRRQKLYDVNVRSIYGCRKTGRH